MSNITKNGYHKSIFKSKRRLFYEGIDKMIIKAARRKGIPDRAQDRDLFAANHCELKMRQLSEVVDLYVDGLLVSSFPDT